jgi:DNA-binding NarL/FixJ family response regulator
VSAAERIRVAVADDHKLFREGMAALLDSVPEIDTVGSVADGEAAIALAQTEKPSVFLMDLRMPGIGGLEALRRIRRAVPEVAVVMLTMVDDDDALAEALHEGAVGYVLKGADTDEMLRVVRAAHRGEVLFGASVARRARDLMSAGRQHTARPFPHLSERERDVLDLLASGFEVQQIAHTLSLSPKTVRNYLTALPRRLRVENRDEAIETARQAGLGRRR